MTLLSPSLLRGLSVMAIGGALAIAHATFASAAPSQTRSGPATAAANVAVTGTVGSGEALGENCWIELVQEKTASGKIVTRRVQDCD